MEKEIKVRKKRFAAFWAVVLLVCSLMVPMMVSALGEDGVLTESDKSLSPGTAIRAEKIIYQDSNGNLLDTISQTGSGGWQNIKQYAELTNAAIDEGYEFEYWRVTANSGNTLEYDSVKYPESVTLTAQLKAKSFTITFKDTDGSEIDSITAAFGSTISTPPNPTKIGHTFASWDREIPATMPAENITITARWTQNQYNIHYEADGGTHENTATTYTYGVGIGSFMDASKEGYTFAGWYKDAVFTTPVTSISVTDTGEITLYAKFVYNSGKIQAGTYYLKKDTQYQLDGVQHVSGDASVYASGAYFYVPADGSYTFS